MIRFIKKVKIPTKKYFHSTNILKGDGEELPQIDPSTPWEQHSTLIRDQRVFGLFRTYRPIKKDEFISAYPIYTGTNTFAISAAKRYTWGVALFGSYLSMYMYSSEVFSDLWALCICVPCWLPLPFIQYYTTPYVSNIFRLYKKGYTDTIEKLEKDEKLILECVGCFGKRVYNNEVYLKDLRIKKTRSGWSNWEVILRDGATDTGTKRNFYVQDDIGGFRMDRIWGIIEKQSGINNGRWDDKI